MLGWVFSLCVLYKCFEGLKCKEGSGSFSWAVKGTSCLGEGMGMGDEAGTNGSAEMGRSSAIR